MAGNKQTVWSYAERPLNSARQYDDLSSYRTGQISALHVSFIQLIRVSDDASLIACLRRGRLDPVHDAPGNIGRVRADRAVGAAAIPRLATK